ncbi:MAG: hypothetical protein JSW58_08285 [Candidatus Latescibacterota bacterium]|nr:MAG: hypothetical protein JSW58_08285 [Candidatus Latescibacterota bacterium]
MPSLDERGVGECRHDFRDGVCWYCGKKALRESGGRDKKPSDEEERNALKSLAEKVAEGPDFKAELERLKERCRETLGL